MTVEDWLAGHEAEALATLRAFCCIASVSTDPAYAAGIREAAAFVAARLTEAGFPQVELVETGGHPCVVAEWCAVPGAPTVLFRPRIVSGGISLVGTRWQYDVAPDGRFLINVETEEASVSPITLILNWNPER